MAARIGRRIREVLAVIERLGPSMARHADQYMDCNVENTSKYLQRSVALGLATRVAGVGGSIYSAAPDWRDKVGAPQDLRVAPKVKSVGITEREIRKRRANVGNPWAGL